MNKEKIIWLALGTGAAIGAGIAARQGAAEAWRRTLREEPPTHAAERETSWPRLLAWAAISGFSVAFARVLSRGVAVGTWQRLLGRTPPE
ncbi:DUF4235 domain-containing protein [Salinisphaera sp. SPP-AMP-43]|uniref:DUF4235 domain-containing protein n=1 Tax=Salinisphaera sp. SPP-AMP-43 TaxID=3121288 RepID=UPI003C6DCD60